MVLVLIARRDEIDWGGIPPISLLAFLGWATVSVIWSQYQWVTIGGLAYLFGFTFLGLFIAFTRDTIQIVRADGRRAAGRPGRLPRSSRCSPGCSSTPRSRSSTCAVSSPSSVRSRGSPRPATSSACSRSSARSASRPSCGRSRCGRSPGSLSLVVAARLHRPDPVADHHRHRRRRRRSRPRSSTESAGCAPSAARSGSSSSSARRGRAHDRRLVVPRPPRRAVQRRAARSTSACTSGSRSWRSCRPTASRAGAGPVAGIRMSPRSSR